MTNYPELPPLSIIFEDDHIIVVNKPSNMLSVPGNINIERRLPRQEEWMNSVREASRMANTKDTHTSTQAREALSTLSNIPNTPRKEKNFLAFVKRTLNSTAKLANANDLPPLSEETVAEMWRLINVADDMLYRKPHGSISHIARECQEWVSAVEWAEEHCHCKLYVVHRLDQATSGAFLMAKSQHVAAHLAAQFRDRKHGVHKCYLAELAGKLTLLDNTHATSTSPVATAIDAVSGHNPPICDSEVSMPALERAKDETSSLAISFALPDGFPSVQPTASSWTAVHGNLRADSDNKPRQVLCRCKANPHTEAMNKSLSVNIVGTAQCTQDVAGEESDNDGEPSDPFVVNACCKASVTLVRTIAHSTCSFQALAFDDLADFNSTGTANATSILTTTVVELVPVTGRTHQLRVHCAQVLGCPMLGDTLYAPPKIASALPRLALHAYKLQFLHPITAATICVTAPLAMEGIPWDEHMRTLGPFARQPGAVGWWPEPRQQTKKRRLCQMEGAGEKAAA